MKRTIYLIGIFDEYNELTKFGNVHQQFCFLGEKNQLTDMENAKIYTSFRSTEKVMKILRDAGMVEMSGTRNEEIALGNGFHMDLIPFEIVVGE